jgi:hypothetical protein
MSIQGITKPNLQDIKTVTVECHQCRRTRLYTSAEVASGNVNSLPGSQCVCAGPTEVLLALISQAKHFNSGFRITLEF